MSDFGRALKRIFANGDTHAEDLDWLELVSPIMLAHEARAQCVDAGRVSTARPYPLWLRGAALWREHARREGSTDSIARALKASDSAAHAIRNLEEAAHAAVDRAKTLLLAYDLQGGVDRLTEADNALPLAGEERRPPVAASIVAVRARVRTRLARLSGDREALVAAAGLMDAAIAAVEASCAPGADELRLERAALALETGIERRDGALLDQAGSELRRLVSEADPDRRPLTRARALTLCAAGLAALARLANDDAARVQAERLFEGAADQFTADHSPLDWVAVQLARAAQPGGSLAALKQAEAMTAGRGLVLGALTRDRRLAMETAAAETVADTDRLERLRAEILKRLSAPRVAPSREATPMARHSDPDWADLDWAVDQIGLARLDAAKARLANRPTLSGGVLSLFEAAEIARERGVPALAEAAETLMPVRTVQR